MGVEWLKYLSPATLAAIDADLAGSEPANKAVENATHTLQLADGRVIEGQYRVYTRGLPDEGSLRKAAMGTNMEEFVGCFGSKIPDKVPVYDDYNNTVVHVDATDKDFYLGKNPQQQPERPYIDILPPTNPEEIIYV